MRFFPSTKTALAAIALFALARLPAGALSYSVTDLGTLGGATSSGAGINNSGQVTGFAADALGNNHAFLYTRGATVDLGMLAGKSSFGVGINNSGQVTGYYYLNTGYAHAFLYSNGVMNDIGVLPGGAFSFGYGVNESGQITGYATDARGNDQAFLYDKGVMTGLPTLGGVSSRGVSINNSGQIAGSTTTLTATTHAFLYSGSATQDLGTLLGGANSYGQSINGSGQVAGALDASGGASHAFLFTNGVLKNLGMLPGDTSSFCNSINNSGQITGSSQGSFGSGHAFLYRFGQMVDLNSLLSPADRSGWILTQGNGINDKGQITGVGLHNGVQRAFLLTPMQFDLNGDGHDDLVFQSQSTRSVVYVTLNGTQFLASDYMFHSIAAGYKVVGICDMNGDGKPDMLFQSQSNGSVVYSILNGLVPTPQYGFLFPVSPPLPTGYVVVGTPDLNGDGHPDVILQRQSTGDLVYVFLHDLTFGASGYLFRGINPNLKLVGTPDLNGDGHPDLLFQDMKTGDVEYALMNGTVPLTPTSYGTIFHNIPLEYQIVGTLDLNGDGMPDILFEGQTNGDVSYVLMNGLTYIPNSFALMFRGVNPDYKIVGVH